MRLIELTMENFRCYSPKSVIGFPQVDNKPVVTIVGENGSGKTSIFLAIIWALYGERAIRRYADTRLHKEQIPTSNLDLMNKEVSESSPRPFMRVSLVFEHESKKFTLRRSVTAARANPRSNRDLKPEDLNLLEHGKANPEDYPMGVLDDILPFDASQFFFFDGEDVRRFSGSNEKATRTAIELVLGIPEIREARDDLVKVQQKLLNKLKEEPEVTETISTLTDSLSKAIDDSKNFSSALSSKKTELSSIDEDLARAQIRRSELKEIAEENTQLQGVIAEKKAVESSISSNEQQYRSLVLKLPYYLVTPQVATTLDRFKRISGTDDLSGQIGKFKSRIELVDEILKDDKCVCDRELDQPANRHLLLLRQTLDSRLKETELRASKKTVPPIDEIQYVLGRLDSIQVDFNELNRTINGLKVRLIQLDDRRLELEKKIKGSNVEEAVKIQTLIEQLIGKKSRLEGEIETLEKDLNSSLSLKSKLENALSKAQFSKGSMTVIAVRHQLAAKTAQAFDWVVNELSVRKREMIVENASRYFSNIAGDAGWKGIEIDEDYSIWLINAQGRRILPSAGWNELVALSLIYGLNKAASFKAPVVMDFVLGRLDSVRQLAVTDNLGDFADQVVLLLLDSEIQLESVERKIRFLSVAGYKVARDGSKATSVVELEVAK
ncbi:MAG TPA: AAA family ATPase [Nitrososphaerales archaeon]|nr:AAA family ATPase [Nitrososphaerales archaeon]